MKKYLCILICFFVCTLSLQAQKGTIPNVKTEKMDGSPMQFREILSDSIPVILTFWSTMCKPCIAELDAFSDEYEDLKRELKFKIVAVALDDERTVAKVKALVKGHAWPFEILLDKNQELKRAMNVSMMPQLFILDKSGKIVYAHTGYTPGSEAEVIAKVRELQ